MPAANQADLLGEGAFGTQQRPDDPNDQPNPRNPGGISNNELLKREAALKRSGSTGRAVQPTAAGRKHLRATNKTANARNDVWGDIDDIWTSDPVTTSILAAPYAVMGAGALIPAAMGGVGGAGLIPSTAATTGAAESAAAGAAGAFSPAAAGAAGAGAAGAGAAGAGAAGAAGAAAGGLSLADAIGLGGLGLSGIGLVASQIKTGPEKALIAKQKELAEATEQRRKQQEQERLNRLGQQLLAFNPLNQAMARMYGPEAAFSPDQMSQLAGDPGAKSRADYEAAKAAQKPGGTMQGWTGDDEQRMLADERRRASVQAAFQPPAAGPAPLQKRAPAPARRY